MMITFELMARLIGFFLYFPKRTLYSFYRLRKGRRGDTRFKDHFHSTQLWKLRGKLLHSTRFIPEHSKTPPSAPFAAPTFVSRARFRHHPSHAPTPKIERLAHPQRHSPATHISSLNAHKTSTEKKERLKKNLPQKNEGKNERGEMVFRLPILFLVRGRVSRFIWVLIPIPFPGGFGDISARLHILKKRRIRIAGRYE